MNFSDKTLIITGGANGIGKGILNYFLTTGCQIIILDKDAKSANEIAFSHANVQFIETDLNNPNDILKAFNFIKDRFKTIDILINNAGVSIFKPLLDLSVEEWDDILNTNLRAAFLCAKEFAKMHSKGCYGRIINIASTRHLMSEPNGEAYAASKGGLVSLTHALAISLQDVGMTVNCISPGWIHTDKTANINTIDKAQHPAKRVGNVQDIASFCMYLCQPESDFITGQNFYIDGGMTKKMMYEE